MRVLIAGGDTEFLELEQRFLSHCGHDATIAHDGLECASILQHFIPDVVVIDCELLWGGSDGVVAIMLEDPRLSQTPVILWRMSIQERHTKTRWNGWLSIGFESRMG